jgi:EF hand
MYSLTKLTLASALMLSAAFGVAQAQQSTNPPAPPAAECVDGQGPGCDDTMRGGDRFAERGEGRHGGRHEGHGGRHGGKGMRIIDANNDGVIGADEAAALADGAFMRMDQDRDGKVTETEFTQGPRGKRGGWFNWSQAETDAVMKVRKDRFTALDANKDASLDKTEFFADAQAKLAAADADKDGKVTPWEFRAAN